MKAKRIWLILRKHAKKLVLLLAKVAQKLFGEIRAKMLCNLKNLPAPVPMIKVELLLASMTNNSWEERIDIQGFTNFTAAHPVAKCHNPWTSPPAAVYSRLCAVYNVLRFWRDKY